MKGLKPSATVAESLLNQPPRAKAVAFAVAMALSPALYGQNLPTGLQTVTGTVTVTNPKPTSMGLIQSSQNAGMTSQTFSIGSGYRVDVVQPNRSSVMVMDVLGGTKSSIFGTLTANGHFFLVNPAGVMFAPGSSVDVGGLVATTMPISLADATSGRYVFTNNGNSGSVEVQKGATITALNGFVGLFAPKVINEGLIVARMGSVALAAGNQVTLDMVGDGLIKVTVNEAALNAMVMNKGTIQADGGNVLLAARSADALLDTVINTDGIIRANSISNRNGAIVLDGGSAGVVSVSGTIDAKGAEAGTRGGTVKILGDRVAVGLPGAAASIDASGDAGGGTVLVGGNFQGKGAEQNALVTYLGKDATINVNAGTSGNGGKAIVWADDTTRAHGTINARGGTQGGDGGFVEVSGKQSLIFKAHVDTRAPNGRTGMLLLDPANILIRGGTDDGSTAGNGGDGSNDGNTTFQGDTTAVVGSILGAGDGSPTRVFQSELEGIASTTNISVQATNNITFQPGSFPFTNNRIDFQQTAGNSVTLDAGNRLAIASVGMTTGGGDLILKAGAGGIAAIGTINVGAGTVTLDTIGSANQTGAITADTLDLRGAAGTFTLNKNNVVTNLKANTNTLTTLSFRNDASFTVAGIDAATSVTLQSDGTVNQSGVISTPLLTLTATTPGSGDFTLNTQNNVLGTVSSTNQVNTVALRDDAGFTVGALNAATSVTLRSDGPVNQSGVISTPLLTLRATTQGSGDFTLNTQNNVLGTVSSANKVNTAALRDDAGFTVGTLNAATSVTLQSNGTVDQSGVITTPLLTLTATTPGSGNFTLDTQNNKLGTVTSSNTVNTAALRDDAGFTVGALAADTSVTLQSDGTVNQSGVITTPLLTLTATTGGSGNFVLNTQNNVLGTVTSTNTVNTAALRDDAGFTVGTLAADTSVTLQSDGTVNQSGVISTPLLKLTATTPGSGDFTLNTQNNVLGTVSSTNQVNTVALRDDAGFTVGALNAATSVTLRSDGPVNQSGVISTPLLTLRATTQGSGDFTLNTQNNVLGTVSSANKVNTAALRDDAGFTVGTLNAATSVTLQSNGTVDQSGVITTPLLTLTATTGGSGNFTLDTQNNVLGTVTSSNTVNTAALRDDAGFTVGALAADTSVTLQSDGTVNQSGVITTPLLTLTATTGGSGNFVLNTQNNVLGTVTSTNTVNTAALRDDAGFTVGTLAADTSVTLQSDGTVNQSGVISTPLLKLTATTPGSGDFTLNTQNNVLGTVTSSNTVNTAALRDDAGFTVGALNAATSVTLRSDGPVNQSGVISTPLLTLRATTQGSGDFTLNTQNNVLGTVSSANKVNTAALRDDAGFTVGTLNAATSVTLQSNGTVDQSGVITTPLLTLTATTGGSGNFTLDTQNNVLGTVTSSNTVNTAALRDDAGFTVGALAADTSVTLQSDGTVNQSGVITTPLLTLTATTGGSGNFVLNTQNNVLGTVTSTNTVNTAALRDDAGFTVGTLAADTSVTLQSDGTVNQSGVISTPLLKLTATTPGSGDFTLNTQNNVLGTVSSTNQVNTVALRDDAGFTVGALNAATSVTLRSDGPVNQSGVISTPLLTLRATTQGSGDFTLNTQNNVLGTVSSANKVNTAALRDDAGFTVGTLNAATSVTLQSNGTVDQSGVITTPLLTLTATTGGSGNFTLDTQNNVLGTVTSSNTVNTAALRDDAGFTVGALAADTSVTLQSDGTVNQSGVITTPLLTLTATTGGSGNFVLNTQNNVLGTVTSTNTVNTAALRDDAGFTVGTLAADTSVTLQSDGTVNQSGVISTPLLKLTATTPGSGDFTLNTQNNVLGTVSSTNQVNTVALRDDAGFTVGTLNAATSVTLQSNGTVDQSGVISTPLLTLRATTQGSGDFTLNTQNNVLGTVSSANKVNTAALRDDAGFTVGTLNAATSVTLQSDGTVDQSGVITTPLLTLTATTGGSGNFVLNTQNNVLGTVTSTNTVNTAALRDDAGFTVGALAADTSVTLQSDGTVNQSGVITTPLLTLTATTGGSGNFVLNTQNNVLGTVTSTNTVNTAALRDDAGFTVGELEVDTSVTLQSNGTVNQSEVISTPLLKLTATTPGSGDFTLNTQNNVLGTVSSTNQVNTVALRDDAGFTVGALNAATSVTLRSDGPVNQSGVISTPLLTLRATTQGSGDFTLNTQNNVLGTVSSANKVNTAALRDDAGFTVGTLNAATSVTLQSNGTVDQSGVITTPLLTLTATTGGSGNFTLDTQNNVLGTVTSSNTVNTAALRDDAGFTVGALAADTSVTLQSDGTVNQSGVISTPLLTLTATTGGSGNFVLNTQNNVLGTVTSTNTVNTAALRDDAGFTVGTLAADTSVTLQSDGTVNQSGVISTPLLTLTATTGGSGNFALNTQNNVLGTVTSSNTVNTAALRDDAGFTVGTLAADTSVTLRSNGTVNQSGVISTPLLTLTATTGGSGNFVLNTQNNVLGTVTSSNTVNTAALRDDAGFTLGALAADTSVTLQSDGTVNQSGVITTPLLTLTATTGGSGNFTLDTQNNVLGTVTSSNTVNTAALRDDAGFTVGALAADTSVRLRSNGTVNQSGVINTVGLELLGTGATYSLNSQTNTITTLAGNTGTVNLLDSGGLGIGTVNTTVGLSTTGPLTINTSGALAQTQAITAGGSSSFLVGANAITLTNSANNFVGPVSLTGGTTQIVDVNELTLGTLNTGALKATSTGALNLGQGSINGALNANSNGGAITQSGALTIAGTSIITAGAGSINLGNTGNNFVGAVTASSSAGGVTFTDVNSFTPTTINSGTGAITINAATLTGGSIGTGTTTGAITLNVGTISGGTIGNLNAGMITVTSNSIAPGTTFTGGGNASFTNTATAVTGVVLNFASASHIQINGNVGPWDMTGSSPIVQGPYVGFTIPTLRGTMNGVQVLFIDGAADAAAATAQASAANAAADAGDVFGTDSVAQQIEYGFAGDVGTLPPIDHRLQGVGISVPVCFNESREGESCAQELKQQQR